MSAVQYPLTPFGILNAEKLSYSKLCTKQRVNRISDETIEFYKTFWSLLGKFMVASFNEAFQ